MNFQALASCPIVAKEHRDPEGRAGCKRGSDFPRKVLDAQEIMQGTIKRACEMGFIVYRVGQKCPEPALWHWAHYRKPAD